MQRNIITRKCATRQNETVYQGNIKRQSVAGNDNLISIIVPVYNVEKWLGRCLNSIKNQSYENYELILVDDGSSDNSGAICDDYAQNDKRVKVIHQKNGGQAAARNKGVSIANGDYYIFIDSDDYVSSNYIMNLYLAAKSGAFDMVQCGLKITTTGEFDKGEPQFSESHVKELTKVEALNRRKFKVSVCGAIYSARIMDGLTFTTGIVYEDDDFYYRAAYAADKLAILEEDLYYYFMSDNSTMRNREKDKRTDYVDIYLRRIRFFEDRNEKELLAGTYDRFCLVLMLSLASAKVRKHNLKDIPTLWDYYKASYRKIYKSPFVPLTDKLMFTCYRVFPRISSHAICKIRG